MKRFLSLTLLVVLIASMLTIASSATSTTIYWSIDSNCLVKAKALDGRVPTYKAATGDCNGLIVGLPTTVKSSDGLFQPRDDKYRFDYISKSGTVISKDEDIHIGTGDKIVVYDENNEIAATYGLVTYGDADGDGVFDVIDAYIASLCLNGHIKPEESPAVYESVKPRIDYDNENVDILDYQQIVNDAVSNNSSLEANLKGLKIPVDDTINFESVIYACDGEEKAAAVNIPDSTFKENVKIEIKYNGQNDVPSAPGIYSVTADVPSNTDYLVTPGERELGFIVIAPKNGTGYTVDVDNANEKITVNISNYNASDATFDSYISAWYNAAYKLTMAGNSVSDGAGVISALSPRMVTKYGYTAGTAEVFDTSTFKMKTITTKLLTLANDTEDILGCYLPDDYTLWNNNEAANIVNVSVNDNEKVFDFTLNIRQDKNKLHSLKKEYIIDNADKGRGQRGENPATSVGEEGWFSSKKVVFVEGKVKPNDETGLREPTIRVVHAGKSDASYPSLKDAFNGTGLKGTLLEHYDAICFVTAGSKAGLPAINGSSNLLYNEKESNRHFGNYTGQEIISKSGDFTPLINKVLEGLGAGTINFAGTTQQLNGKSGWCRYACADDSTGIRYTIDYYLEFKNVDSTNDYHRSLTVVSVNGCTIDTTNPNQKIKEVKDSEGNVISSYYLRDRMLKDEPFKVVATLKAGYKLSVTDADDNPVEYDAVNGWYIMPNSDVTVTAVPQ